ncbi:hypothetical protein AB1N83_006673 [Pleurotus pulmonarius]
MVAVVWCYLPTTINYTTTIGLDTPEFTIGHIAPYGVLWRFDGTTGILSSLAPIKNIEDSPSRSPNQPILTGPCSRKAVANSPHGLSPCHDHPESPRFIDLPKRKRAPQPWNQTLNWIKYTILLWAATSTRRPTKPSACKSTTCARTPTAVNVIVQILTATITSLVSMDESHTERRCSWAQRHSPRRYPTNPGLVRRLDSGMPDTATWRLEPEMTRDVHACVHGSSDLLYRLPRSSVGIALESSNPFRATATQTLGNLDWWANIPGMFGLGNATLPFIFDARSP